MVGPAASCVGCEKKAAPGGKERQIERPERWGNRRRRSRRRGAAAAIEWRAPRTEPQAVARSVLPEARAEVSALVRALLHGAVRSPVTGEARTGDARSATATSRGAARSRRSRPGRAKRGPRRARRAAPSRGGRGGDVNGVVERGRNRVGPARGGERASRRANGVRSDQRERRREGYPPEGSRPRSGLGRVARSRSDALSLDVWSSVSVSIFGIIITVTVTVIADSIGTIVCITVCTIAV